MGKEGKEREFVSTFAGSGPAGETALDGAGSTNKGPVVQTVVVGFI